VFSDLGRGLRNPDARFETEEMIVRGDVPWCAGSIARCSGFLGPTSVLPKNQNLSAVPASNTLFRCGHAVHQDPQWRRQALIAK
jgi:hypothetical protein